MGTTTDQQWTTIAFGPEAEGLGVALDSLCELNLAVGIELRDGRHLDGVLSEVVGDHLALRGFDNHLAVHTEELLMVQLSETARIEIT